MVEKETLKAYVARYIELTDEESAYFESILRVTKLRKKQFVAQPDFVCKYTNYVYSGAMRAYLVDSEGNEHTIGLAIDDWWITDYNSLIFQTPGTLFVEALEETVLVQIDYNDEQKLLERIPKFERFFRIITQRSFAFLQRRMLSNLSMSAEQRFEEFQAKYPQFVLRMPQYALASYLGMSTEYFSKLRNKRIVKKT